MKAKDLLALVGAKLKIRKLRTIITILTTSLLFGVIITILFVTSGFFNSLTTLAKTTLSSDILLVVNHETAGLGTPHTRADALELSMKQAQESKDIIAKTTEPYQGEVVTSMYHYCTTGSLSIERLTPLETASFMTCIDNPGESVITVDSSSVLAPLIKVPVQKNDVIQILIPFDQAAQIANIDKPSPASSDKSTGLRKYVEEVNKKAIGLQFTGTLTSGGQKNKIIPYEIVGLLPSQDLSTLDPQSINPLETTLNSLVSKSGSSESYSFIVTNPQSSAFQNFYNPNLDRFSNDTIVSFKEARNAEAFIQERGQASEFISNQISLRSTSNTVNRFIGAFTIVFSIIAVVIMAGTISRVIDDERQTIALYRAVGATTRNILTVYIYYIAAISLLVIICSTILGAVFAGVITLVNTSFITANLSAMYNIPDITSVILIGFDYRILFVYLATIAIGLICLLYVLGKLTTKNLVKDLRK